MPVDFKKEYPFAPHFFELPGGPRMHYVDEGKGHAVIMLHGNPSWSFLYRNVVKALSKDYRCIVPDHIGCGLSDKPQNYDYTLAQHIANVENLVDHLGLESYDLIVHDWGGAIGSGLAVRKPERIRKLVILNTAAFHIKRIPFRISLCRLPLLGKLLVQGFNAFAAGATCMAVSRKMTPAVKAGFVAPYGNWNDRIATHRFIKDIPLEKSHKSYPILKGIEELLPVLLDKPMFIGWGGQDFCFNDRFYEEWQRRFPNAQCEYVPYAGHYVLEDAGENLIPAIQDFLKG